ncbi:MAG: ATP-binding protein [Deltaproteobacteria bacterium]|nr:ATP-binding protein [Deltaproteobacteria bacterium]MBI4374680.1 ATP-binding protein [Deltaproteobacteria bacterium]
MFNRWLKKPTRSTLLLGPRRAGKSTYLRATFPDFKYLTLDDLDILDLAEKDPKAILEGSSKIIIDEVQRVPKLTIAAKFAIDERKATVLMSGSSRIGLLDASADSLAGRIDIQSLPPACWGEEQGLPTHSIFEGEAPPLQIREAERRLDQFMTYGGFPEVLVAPDNNEKAAILNNYRNTYFTRDLSLLSNLQDVSGLRAILNHYALSIGSITQIENFRQESGLSHITAKKYLESIYASDLGFSLKGFQHGPAKRYIKGVKSYYCDSGMIMALGVQCSRGQIVENFVISEIEKRRKLGLIKTDQLYFYKSTSGFEIDVVIQEKDLIRVIEIKSTMQPQKKDVKNLAEFVRGDADHTMGYLFYMGQEYRITDGIRCIPIAGIYRGG